MSTPGGPKRERPKGTGSVFLPSLVGNAIRIEAAVLARAQMTTKPAPQKCRAPRGRELFSDLATVVIPRAPVGDEVRSRLEDVSLDLLGADAEHRPDFALAEAVHLGQH